MGSRLELHEKLKAILGSNNVYFQPPMSIRLKYPCIIYTRTKIDARYADDTSYLTDKQYTITLIYSDPDSDLPDKLMKLPAISHVNNQVIDNLYHDYFKIYN